MVDRSTDTEQPPTSSPWPILVAAGLALSGVGAIVDLFPVAVGGLVLFAASVTGFVTESDHVSSPWPIAIGLGLAFVVGGSVLYAAGTDLLAIETGVGGLASRGLAITVAGVATIVGTVLLRYRAG